MRLHWPTITAVGPLGRSEKAAWKRCWTPAQGVNATDLRQPAFNLSAPDLELAESFDRVRVCMRVRCLQAPQRVYVRARGCCPWRADRRRLPVWHVWHLTDTVTSWRNLSPPPLPPPPLLNPAASMRPWSSYQHTEGNFLVNRRARVGGTEGGEQRADGQLTGKVSAKKKRQNKPTKVLGSFLSKTSFSAESDW